MKKLAVLIVGCLFAFGGNSQITDEGRIFTEVNTNFGAIGSTGIRYINVKDGGSQFTLGFDAGYFIANDLALKLGFGYTSSDNFAYMAYKLGAKYYINSTIPIAIDLTGFSGDLEGSLLGVQGGYAINLSENVNIEPGIRYNVTLDDLKQASYFEFNVGFVVAF